MTTLTDQYTQFLQQAQEAVRTSVDTWTNTVKTVTEQVPAFSPQIDAAGAIDRYFDVSEKVLEAQRDFAKRLLTTATATAA